MGWKGTIRSLEAASRRAARDADRRAKIRQKETERAEAVATVEAYELYRLNLIGLHKTTGSQLDWNVELQKSKPLEPVLDKSLSQMAKDRLESYTPFILIRLLGLEAWQMKKLEVNFRLAKETDEMVHDEKLRRHEIDCAAWQVNMEVANGIVNQQEEAFLKALQLHDRFTEISQLGSNVNFSFTDDGTFNIALDVHSNDVIPDVKYSVLKSGRLSEKAMPKGEFNELYQDYVCSALLRSTLEVFAVLPLKSLVATAFDSLVNPSTGHLEKQALVSVFIPNDTLLKINLNQVDPSDCFGNFLHNMQFKKTQGFVAVDVINSPEKSF